MHRPSIPAVRGSVCILAVTRTDISARLVRGTELNLKREVGADNEAFRAHWMTYPLQWVLQDSTPHDARATIQLVAAGELISVEVDGGHIRVSPGNTQPADLTIKGHPDAIMGLLLGRIPISQAAGGGAAGLRSYGAAASRDAYHAPPRSCEPAV